MLYFHVSSIKTERNYVPGEQLYSAICMKSQALLLHLNTEVLHANELMIIRAIQGLSIKKKEKKRNEQKSHKPQAFSSNFFFVVVSLCESNIRASRPQLSGVVCAATEDHFNPPLSTWKRQSNKSKHGEGEASIVCVAGVAGNWLLVAAEKPGL